MIDTGLTFGDLIIRLSVAVNMPKYGTGADNRAVLPTDPQTLDEMKKAVNDGLSQFYRDNPRWSFLKRTVTLTLSPDGTGPQNINGDPARYALPWHVTGVPRGGWVLSGTGLPARTVPIRDWETLASIAAATTTGTGMSTLAAHRPRNDFHTTGVRRGWEVRFWPAPQSAWTAEATFYGVPPPMVEPADRHIAGAIHDDAVLCSAVWAFERFRGRKTIDERAYMERLYKEALAAAMRIDAENAPSNLGPMADADRRHIGNGQDWGEYALSGPVESYNGVPIP